MEKKVIGRSIDSTQHRLWPTPRPLFQLCSNSTTTPGPSGLWNTEQTLRRPTTFYVRTHCERKSSKNNHKVLRESLLSLPSASTCTTTNKMPRHHQHHHHHRSDLSIKEETIPESVDRGTLTVPIDVENEETQTDDTSYLEINQLPALVASAPPLMISRETEDRSTSPIFTNEVKSEKKLFRELEHITGHIIIQKFITRNEEEFHQLVKMRFPGLKTSIEFPITDPIELQSESLCFKDKNEIEEEETKEKEGESYNLHHPLDADVEEKCDDENRNNVENFEEALLGLEQSNKLRMSSFEEVISSKTQKTPSCSIIKETTQINTLSICEDSVEALEESSWSLGPNDKDNAKEKESEREDEDKNVEVSEGVAMIPLSVYPPHTQGITSKSTQMEETVLTSTSTKEITSECRLQFDSFWNDETQGISSRQSVHNSQEDVKEGDEDYVSEREKEENESDAQDEVEDEEELLPSTSSNSSLIQSVNYFGEKDEDESESCASGPRLHINDVITSTTTMTMNPTQLDIGTKSTKSTQTEEGNYQRANVKRLPRPGRLSSNQSSADSSSATSLLDLQLRVKKFDVRVRLGGKRNKNKESANLVENFQITDRINILEVKGQRIRMKDEEPNPTSSKI